MRNYYNLQKNDIEQQQRRESQFCAGALLQYLNSAHCFSSRPSIRPKDLSAYPSTLSPTQPNDRLCDFLWRPNSSHRTKTCNEFQHLLRLAFVEQVCASRAWCHCIHTYALSQKVFGHDPCHLFNGSFAGSVEEVGRGDDLLNALGGGNEHDM